MLNKIIEWELVSYCSMKCFYCFVPIINHIKTDLELFNIYNFIDNELKETVKNDELFIFGGEPFLHPYINQIIKRLKLNNINFKIQTQLCKASFDKIYTIVKKCNINLHISYHPSEQDEEDVVNDLIKIYKINKNTIQKIDMMCGVDNIINKYLYFKSILPKEYKELLHLTPVVDFGINSKRSMDMIEQYNIIRRGKWSKLIQWETTPDWLHDKRSFIWEDMRKGGWTTKGKPCIYKNNYIVYTSNLKKFNCHNLKNVEVCEDHCFLM